jgi:hypothetical protein
LKATTKLKKPDLRTSIAEQVADNKYQWVKHPKLASVVNPMA